MAHLHMPSDKHNQLLGISVAFQFQPKWSNYLSFMNISPKFYVSINMITKN